MDVLNFDEHITSNVHLLHVDTSNYCLYFIPYQRNYKRTVPSGNCMSRTSFIVNIHTCMRLLKPLNILSPLQMPILITSKQI